MTDIFPSTWGGQHTVTPQNIRHELHQDLLGAWRSVYCYQGLPALLRCLSGTRRLLRGTSSSNVDLPALDCLTCSVIPEIASLWQFFASRALSGLQPHVLLADSSGNLNRTTAKEAHILPLFNFNHGTKLDLLMRFACQAEFVLICDDDIFWLNQAPLDWALEQFARDDQLAVVSFHPRPHKIPQLRDALDEAMGSYCLLVRRNLWLEQDLSFKFYKSPDWKTIGNYFDTADYANLHLVQRGFRVLMAPPEMRAELVTFYGTSMWGLKILACRGQVAKVVNPNRPDEYKKAYRTALALLGFQHLLALSSSPQKALIPPQYLQPALGEAALHLDRSTRSETEQDIQAKLNRLQANFSSWTQTKLGNSQG